MAEDSDGTLQAVVICEGDLHDPDFPQKFRSLVGKLKSILDPPKRRKRFLKINKVEPWNSVRVTLSIPKDAASKLRQLAAEGSAALRALGILSVQLEGDTVISLRLVGQEIVLRTENENAPALNGQNSAAANDFTNLLARVPTPQNNQQPQATVCAGSGEGPSGLSTAIKQQHIIRMNSMESPMNGPVDAKAIFKSPNTICPMDGKLPTPVPSNVIESREYPFESMTQASRLIQRRENTMGQQIQNPLIRPTVEQQTPPPPYPGASPTRTANMMNIVTNKIALNQQPSTSGNIAISSPLLVNLLQNEPAQGGSATAKTMMATGAPPTTIVKNGQEIVILSNNSMQPHQMQQQVNHTPNFVIANSGGPELGFNKCIVNKQTIQSPNPHHQMRVQQQTFVNVSAVPPNMNESIQQQPQQQTLIHSNNKDNNSERNLNNSSVLSTVPQQANSIVIAGNATTVPSTINSVNKIQSRYPQQQAIPPQFQQQFANQPQIRATMIAQNANTPQNHHHPNGQQPIANILSLPPNQLNTSPQTIPAQVVLQQKQPQIRAMHSNMVAQQQQIIGANMHQVEFRQPNPANVVLQQNQIQANQMQQFQQQNPQMQQPQIIAGNAIQFNTPMGSQQPQMDQSTFNARWPLKPMDSATQSSFQEFTRYQMQYNLSQQQQQSAPDDSLADQLADLDEITRTDLESLLPSINDTDLDLGLDMKAPLESLLDPKDLEDLIHPSSEPMQSSTAAMSGTGIPPPNAVGMVQPNMLQYQANQQKMVMHPPQQIDMNTIRFRQMAMDKRPMHQMQHVNMMGAPMNVPLQKLSQHQQMVQHRFDHKMKSVGGKEKQVLINPLTGELEPIPSEDSGDETAQADAQTPYNEFNITAPNSIYSDDDNSCSNFSKTSDHSDNMGNSELAGKGKNSGKRKEKKETVRKPRTPKEKTPKASLLKEKLQQGLKDKILGKSKEKNKTKNLPSPIISNAVIAEMSDKSTPEKIKLRLKLEKSEPVSPAYKVDVSFGDTPKRTPSAPNQAASSTSHTLTPNTPANSEELRVPPLHISLRGRNSAVIKNSKKGRKKAQAEDEEKKPTKKSSSAVTTDAPVKLANNTMRSHHSGDFVANNCNSHPTTPNAIEHTVKTEAIVPEASKRLNSELGASTNGPIQAEKKRRLSQSQEMPIPPPSITVGTTLVTSRSSMMPMTDNSVESIREAIGSTNVGTLLSTPKVQKTTTNNNNNSLTLNKAKPANKPKTKTLINMLKESEASGEQQSNSLVDKTMPNDVSPQGTADAIRDDENSQTSADKVSPNDASEDDKPLQSNPVAYNNVDASKESSNSEMKDNELSQAPNTPNTSNPLNAQFASQASEAKDSPRRDTIEGLINASQAIRCSPASQAQGEDSGIESMDALSEKSPHQTASPQNVKRADSPKEVAAKASGDDASANISAEKYSNIEAALAKMEGLNEFTTSDCDKSSVGSDTTCVNQKMNGKHSAMENDSQAELLMNDLVEPANEKTNEILLAALNENNDAMNTTDIVAKEVVELDEVKGLNENHTVVELMEVSANTIKTDDDNNEINVEPTQNDTAKDEPHENIQILVQCETTPITTSTPSPVPANTIADEVEAKVELSPEQRPEQGPIETAVSHLDVTVANIQCENGNDIKSEQVNSEEDKEIEDTMKAMEVDSNDSKLLQQLSIEIPSSDSAPRVRTRASSKLESPLDAQKQSPADSPAGSTRSVKSGAKRKRQESESSTQSNASDDAPIRAKKSRKSGDVTASSSSSSSPTNVKPNVLQKDLILVSTMTTPIYSNDAENTLNRKSEDSSDSDEPLIEVAGKVRNAKMTKISADGEKALRNHQKPTDGQTVTTNNVSAGDSQAKASPLPKGDDKSSAMSTRRSVRMNIGTKVSKASVNSHGLNLNSNENHSDTRKSGNGTAVNSVNSSETASTMEARRKTRSAGLESMEGRRRRLSRDNK